MTTRTLLEPMPIQDWINSNEIDDVLFAKDAAIRQMVLVRDEVSWLLREADTTAQVTVVSWHMSKSVKLPVYRIETGLGTLRLTLRGNFHNWMVSVEAVRPLPDVFFDLFDKNAEISSVYCEGFDGEWVFGPFNADRKTFTVELFTNYQLMTFLYLLSVAAGLR